MIFAIQAAGIKRAFPVINCLSTRFYSSNRSVYNYRGHAPHIKKRHFYTYATDQISSVKTTYLEVLSKSVALSHEFIGPLAGVLSAHPSLAWVVSIAVATASWRVALFPFKIATHLNQVNMQAAQAEYTQRIAPLLARQLSHKTEQERSRAQRDELARTFHKHNVSMLRMLIPIAVNVPLFLGWSRVFRDGMVAGADHFLTGTDWRVALITVMSNALVIHLNKRFIPQPAAGVDQDPDKKWTVQRLMMPMLQVVNAMSFLLLKGMPVGLVYFIACSGWMALLENVVLRSRVLAPLIKYLQKLGQRK